MQFINYFCGVSDPRLEIKNKRYQLKKILALVILAFFCDADSCTE